MLTNEDKEKIRKKYNIYDYVYQKSEELNIPINTILERLHIMEHYLDIFNKEQYALHYEFEKYLLLNDQMFAVLTFGMHELLASTYLFAREHFLTNTANPISWEDFNSEFGKDDISQSRINKCLDSLVFLELLEFQKTQNGIIISKLELENPPALHKLKILLDQPSP